MSINRDLRENNIKCYDEDNLIYVPADEIIKLNGNNKDLILDIVIKSLNVSDNAAVLYKIISHQSPRRKGVDVLSILDKCTRSLAKSNITSVRALKELVVKGVVKYVDENRDYISLHDNYNFNDILKKNIKYIIIENTNL